MSEFTRALLEPTGETRGGRAVYRVAEGFTFDIGYLGSGLAVTVPAGFETDGPSVPAWALWIVDVGAFIKSACVHDMLRQDLRFSKLEGDAIFLTAMAAEGVEPWQRELIFLAVRLNNSRARASIRTI
jgi:hypothetical protein